ncbi:MAG: hypothetical protein ACE5G6_02780 [Terriglobia bacterium]
MSSRDDNGLAEIRRVSSMRWERSPKLWDAVVAVLGGNALYFLVFFDHLPAAWQHQPFALDRGLGLDFVLCLGVLLLLRWARLWFDAGEGER